MNSRIVNKLLKQTAVYWGNPVNDGYGRFTYDDPVEIKCRWEDKQEKFAAPNGEEILSRAVAVIAIDVDLGGRLALTTLNDLDSSALPDSEDSYEIKSFDKSPDYRGKTFVRKAWLV